jgi:octaprenyl-diphosphate synthase
VERLREIVAIVHRTGALEVTRQAALREAEAARQSIAKLPLPMPKKSC